MPISLQSTVGSSGGIQMERLILTSGTFVAPVSASYLVTAIGGGGSGGRAPVANGARSTGGGAGGFAQKTVQLNQGDTLTIVIGAGAATPVNSGMVGSSGGATTVTGPGIALVAGGGGGGNIGSVSGTTAGAVGGTASGGDINTQGGGSGTATSVNIAGCMAFTGGGAVGVYGVGYASGNANSTGAGEASTGGAGTGGRSGNATASSNSATSRGASAISPSPDALNNGSSTVHSARLLFNPTGANYAPDALLQRRLLSPLASRGGEPGVGGNTFSSGVPNIDSNPGLFGGGGAKMAISSLLGGGGGAEWSSGGGGPGGVVIEWVQEIA